MKFSIGQAELANAVALAGQSVSTRSTLPVLGNVLLKAEGDALTVTGTNLETALSVIVTAAVTEAGAITLPARLLKDTLAGTPEGARVECAVDEGRMAAQLTYYSGGKRRGQATLKGIDALEYPLTPQPGTTSDLTFAGADLAALIRQSTFAASTPQDTSRPALTGVLWTSNGAGLTAAATDGYRLAVTHKRDAATLPAPLILPARALDLADKLAALAETVTLSVVGNAAVFTFAGARAFLSAQLACQMIDAKFPDYNAILPKSQATTVTLDTAELVRALKMAALFARDASDRVILSVQPSLLDEGSLTVVATAQEAGNYDTDLPAAVEGAALTAAFNVQYLLQGLAALGEPTACLEFTKADRPCVLKGLNFEYVIMPMQIPGK